MILSHPLILTGVACYLLLSACVSTRIVLERTVALQTFVFDTLHVVYLSGEVDKIQNPLRR
ncbi:MAG: hypothetical protein HC903_14060 [Methylacidiphilales bacterium]|nr:hypothetical protein [Candidatus Methylacidiphilales bacterium]NJR19350.1 hypothetical protein [Calothrix sp. CSU_2_0]